MRRCVQTYDAGRIMRKLLIVVLDAVDAGVSPPPVAA